MPRLIAPNGVEVEASDETAKTLLSAGFSHADGKTGKALQRKRTAKKES